MLEDNRNSINKRRSELASMVTTADMDKCSKFIQKVSEASFTKVKERQVGKFNSLINKTSNNNNKSRVSSTGSNSNNNNGSCNNSQMQGSENNNNQTGNYKNSKWVTNLSKTTLTKGQESLLAKGPHFAVAPYNIPSTDYITAVESICHNLKDQDAQELRVNINSLLRRSQTSKPNLTKQEGRGLAQLKEDKDRLVITADKGVALVVIDREDYIQKAEVLLAQLAYRTIDRDPTNKIKARLITKCRTIKKETRLDEGMYKIMYPTSCVPPQFHRLFKIHKTGTPLGLLFPAGAQSPGSQGP